MKAVFLRAGALLLAASLAGCTTTWGGDGGSTRYGTEATRFHLGDPIARGQIAIEGVVPGESATPEFRTYADIVARHLTRLGWTVVNNVGGSEQVAVVNVQQHSLADVRRPPVMIEVRIKRRSDGTIFWEGRASTEARPGAPEAQPVAAVEKLAAALFQDFPGESGRTIRLP